MFLIYKKLEAKSKSIFISLFKQAIDFDGVDFMLQTQRRVVEM